MNSNSEELFLEAEADIKSNNYAKAFKIYESILYEEPDSAPAHNHMGWLYKTQFNNYAKAENHFLAAIKCEPLYPHPYFHVAALLMEMERTDELERHLEKCMKVRTIDKSWVHARYGMMEEDRYDYDQAIYYFEKAILATQSDDKIKDFKQDIERCRMKMEIRGRHKEY